MDQGGDDTDARTAAVLALSRKGLAATTIGVCEVVRDPDAAKLLTKKFDTLMSAVSPRCGRPFFSPVSSSQSTGAP